MTKPLRHLLLTTTGLLLAGLAWAQPGPGMGMGMGGPGGGMGNRPCMSAQAAEHPMCAWRANRRNSPGFALMTPDERVAHQARVRAMKSREECRAYLTEHHAQMAERAQAKGQTLPEPRMRLCDRLPSAR